ncbi:hypothetical protein CYG49_01535 [Candidatus Saccharibacteria bacterium]|nr:MAG: hypothetical protein CYG49_01535 [Candidatus Saccharibacteria bacterium]
MAQQYDTFYDLQKKPSATTVPARDIDLTLAIARAVAEAGGRALIVGGFVRDLVMSQQLNRSFTAKDIDIEVFGIPFDSLSELLRQIHPVNIVGASFGVFKLGTIDVSLPRRDSKTGRGHKGFHIQSDPGMSFADAGRRRDFTVNALGFDPLTGEVLDEHGGIDDIKKKRLRAVDPALFGDDPLRVLRAMQFAGRFGFSIDTVTVEIAQRLDLHELSKERIGEEWNKLLLKAERPSIGLQAARELGVLSKLHPELQALIGTKQEHEWHPEGDVWNHTLMAVDRAAEIVRREGLEHEQALTVLYGALCHDFGKPTTTSTHPETKRIISHEHAQQGVQPTRQFLEGLALPHRLINKVGNLVSDHMFVVQAGQAKETAIRRLARRLAPATIQELLWVVEADFYGRTLAEFDFTIGHILLQKADQWGVLHGPLKPVVLGRDLIALGEQPGHKLGAILEQLSAAQNSGRFNTREEGIEFYKQFIKQQHD